MPAQPIPRRMEYLYDNARCAGASDATSLPPRLGAHFMMPLSWVICISMQDMPCNDDGLQNSIYSSIDGSLAPMLSQATRMRQTATTRPATCVGLQGAPMPPKRRHDGSSTFISCAFAAAVIFALSHIYAMPRSFHYCVPMTLRPVMQDTHRFQGRARRRDA